MYTAIASLLLNIPVRPRLAMTGEITLRGRVLPIGGLKEKTLAASRMKIRTIIMPKQNEPDLQEVHPVVRNRCAFVLVDTVDQVLDHALGARKLAKVISANGRAMKRRQQKK